jgi:hypothetical protein
MKMENTQQINPNPVTLKVKEFRRLGDDSHSDANKYVVPLWIQEFLQELRSQNNKKMVLRSS